MGQIVRMNQAERFEEQFGEIELGMVGFKPGDKLTFKNAFITRRNEDEGVMLAYVFEREDGSTVTLHDDSEPLFTPDDNGFVLTADDAVENELHEHYGLSEEEFRRRWKIVLNED